MYANAAKSWKIYAIFCGQDKVQVTSCLFTKTCAGLLYKKLIDYTIDIVNFVVALGITGKDINKDVFGHVDLYIRPLNNAVSLIETMKVTAHTVSTEVTVDFNTVLQW